VKPLNGSSKHPTMDYDINHVQLADVPRKSRQHLLQQVFKGYRGTYTKKNCLHKEKLVTVNWFMLFSVMKAVFGLLSSSTQVCKGLS